MILGIKTWRYGLSCPLNESIRRVADSGFKFLDINFHLIRYDGEVYYWPKEVAPTYHYEVKRLMKDFQLKAGVVLPKTPLVTRTSLGSVKIDDIAEPSDIPEEKALSLPFRVKLGVNTARDIGAQLLDDVHLPSMARWAELDRLKSIIRNTDLYDVKIGLENRNDTDPKQLLEVFKELNLRSVGLTLDIGHAHKYSRNIDQVAEQIRQLSPFICHVHVPLLMFGFDDVDRIKIIQAFKSAGYDGSLTLEMNPEDCYILSIPPHPDQKVLRYKRIMERLLNLQA